MAWRYKLETRQRGPPRTPSDDPVGCDAGHRYRVLGGQGTEQEGCWQVPASGSASFRTCCQEGEATLRHTHAARSSRSTAIGSIQRGGRGGVSRAGQLRGCVCSTALHRPRLHTAQQRRDDAGSVASGPCTIRLRVGRLLRVQHISKERIPVLPSAYRRYRCAL